MVPPSKHPPSSSHPPSVPSSPPSSRPPAPAPAVPPLAQQHPPPHQPTQQPQQPPPQSQQPQPPPQSQPQQQPQPHSHAQHPPPPSAHTRTPPPQSYAALPPNPPPLPPPPLHYYSRYDAAPSPSPPPYDATASIRAATVAAATGVPSHPRSAQQPPPQPQQPPPPSVPPSAPSNERPPPLPQRPIMLVGPSGPAVMQTMPRYQGLPPRDELLPRLSHTVAHPSERRFDEPPLPSMAEFDDRRASPHPPPRSQPPPPPQDHQQQLSVQPPPPPQPSQTPNSAPLPHLPPPHPQLQQQQQAHLPSQAHWSRPPADWKPPSNAQPFDAWNDHHDRPHSSQPPSRQPQSLQDPRARTAPPPHVMAPPPPQQTVQQQQQQQVPPQTVPHPHNHSQSTRVRPSETRDSVPDNTDNAKRPLPQQTPTPVEHLSEHQASRAHPNILIDEQVAQKSSARSQAASIRAEEQSRPLREHQQQPTPLTQPQHPGPGSASSPNTQPPSSQTDSARQPVSGAPERRAPRSPRSPKKHQAAQLQKSSSTPDGALRPTPESRDDLINIQNQGRGTDMNSSSQPNQDRERQGGQQQRKQKHQEQNHEQRRQQKQKQDDQPHSQLQVQQQSQSQSQTQPQVHTQTQNQAQPHSEQEARQAPQPLQPQSHTPGQTQQQPSAQVQSQAQSQPEISSQPQPQSQSRAQPQQSQPTQNQQQSQPPPARQDGPSEPAPGTPRRQLKVEDALAYLEKVKSQFSEKLSVYNRFLDIMKEFKAQTIDTTEVIRRVSDLFRGHKELILGFNTFLPPGYKIQVTENRATGALSAGFVGPDGYSVLPTYNRTNQPKPSAPAPGPTTNRQSSSKRPSLPVGTSPQKRKDSKKSAPTASAPPAPAPTPPPTQAPVSANADGDDPMDVTPSPRVTSKSNAIKATSSRTGKKATDEEPNALERLTGNGESAMKTHEFERAIGFVTRIKERFSNQPEVFSSFLSALARAREEQTSIRQVFEAVADVFGHHKDLLMQFREFIPQSPSESPIDTKPVTSKPPQRRVKVTGHSTPPTTKGRGANGGAKSRRQRDMKFFEGIKAQLGPSKSHLYNDFIKCLSLLSQGIVSREELLLLTGEILSECPDAHHAFLSYLESMTGAEGSIEDHDPSSASEEEDNNPVDATKMAYYISKPMSEIASEKGIERSFSYRRMPHDFPKLECSGRSAQERRVLNDTWINVTTGSEDYRFMRRNNYEDNLFRCEDDRYELDMVIGSNAAAITKLETILGTMSKLSPNEKKRHALAAGALSPVHFNAIRRIYGDSGDEMVQQVKINPSAAVPVILNRMKLKDRSWRKARAEMNKVWRDVGERNYHRSLDHRSTFFKTVDKKDLSVKSLVMDIIDPFASIAARDAEMTRARSYAIPTGAGGTNNRSGAIKAVMDAANYPRGIGPRRLALRFERDETHKVVFDLIKSTCPDDTSSDSKSTLDEFRRFIEEFFDVDLEKGIRRETNKSKRHKDQQYGPVSSVLYGDEPVYLLLRLYHILYERIETAQVLTEEQTSDSLRRKRLNEEYEKRAVGTSHLPKVQSKPSSFTWPNQNVEHESNFALCSPIEDPKELFEEFMKYLRLFVRGKLEVAKFEDKCRCLLGTNAYTVFTLDKVVTRLAKQISVVYAGDAIARQMMQLLNEAADALARSDESGGRLDGAAAEELHSVEASRLVSDRGSAGLNMFRFSREYCRLPQMRPRDPEVEEFLGNKRTWDMRCEENKKDGKLKALMVIEVIGHTEGEQRRRQRAVANEEVDRFVGFCASYGDCANREEDEEGERNGGSDSGSGGGTGAGGLVNGGIMKRGRLSKRGRRKRNRDRERARDRDREREREKEREKERERERDRDDEENDDEQKRVQQRNRSRSRPNFLKFRPSMAIAEQRVEHVQIENGLRLEYRSPGYFFYACNTEDVVRLVGRKRRRIDAARIGDENEQSEWTKRFRRKLLQACNRGVSPDGGISRKVGQAAS